MNASSPTGDGVLVIIAGGNIGLFADEVRREWVVRPATTIELESLVVGEVPASQRTVGGTIVLRERSVRGVPVRVKFIALGTEERKVYEHEDLDSAQVDPTRWEEIAKRIKAEYNQYEGFVILHGLDTMAYTASALSFMLGNPNVPIVLTGSQRPLNFGRTDAIQNIISSIVIAASRSLGLSPIIQEVCVYSHDTLFRGNRVTMTSSTAYRSFDSPNYAPLAVAGEHIEIQDHVLWRAGNRSNLDYHKEARARVVIVDVFPGMDATLIRNLRRDQSKGGDVSPSGRGRKGGGEAQGQSETERQKGAGIAKDDSEGLGGVLLRTYGMGTAPTSERFLMALNEVVASGVVVMNVTQARSGRISHGTDPVSLRLMEQGVVSGGDMTSEAAYAKMVVLLSEGGNPSERADLLQIARCGEQSQSVFNIHFSEGETLEEESAYFAHLIPRREMVGRHELRLDDITHVQLRLLGVKPAKMAANVNRTIELQASLADQFQEQTQIVAVLAEDTLRWRPEGRETINVTYDVTEATKSHVMQPSVIVRLQTSEAIRWTRASLAVFCSVRLTEP